MDLNEDGILDIVSGSYFTSVNGGPMRGGKSLQGEIFLFAGKKDGSFADGEALKFPNGESIALGPATSVAVNDWNNDGTLDLIMGFMVGPIKFVPNKGNMQFGDPVDLTTSDGKTITAPDGGPCIADWDDDGIDDLLLGDGYGAVLFYKASQSDAGKLPSLTQPIELLPAQKAGKTYVKVKDFESLTLENNWSGQRTKPLVTDWNGDGKKDLIVGDMTVIEAQPLNLTQAQIEERDALEAERQKLLPKMAEISGKAKEIALKKHNLTDEDLMKQMPIEKRMAYFRTLTAEQEKSEDYILMRKRVTEISMKLMDYQERATTHGFVWVYLRK